LATLTSAVAASVISVPSAAADAAEPKIAVVVLSSGVAMAGPNAFAAPRSTQYATRKRYAVARRKRYAGGMADGDTEKEVRGRAVWALYRVEAECVR
jgi:hypothetical protein